MNIVLALCKEFYHTMELITHKKNVVPGDDPSPANMHTIRNQAQHMLQRPFVQWLLCALVACALFLPHINATLVRDEADFVVASQAIDHLGLPIFYQGDFVLAGKPIVRIGPIPGLPGQSTVYEAPDGSFTWVENGGITYKVGNWHPPLYLYLLALFFLLPLPFTIAARLLNLLLLFITLAVIQRLTAVLIEQQTPSSPQKSASTSLIPMAACFAYLLFSFGIRSYVLIDFTTAMAPLTVLIFWYTHIRAPHTLRGVLARAMTLLLVIWTNLGPVPALLLVVLALPLLRWEKRRLVIAASSVALALVLFGLTFEAYSLWEGVPAGATFSHSSAILAQVILSLPHPATWAHLTKGSGTLAIEVLLLLLYGPLVAGATLIVLLRYTHKRPTLRMLLPTIMGGALFLALTLSIAYLQWQHVSIKQGLLVGWQWLPAVGKLLLTNWAGSPFIAWLVPGIACAVLLASARLQTRYRAYVIEMALFAVVMATDVLFIGPLAWGFPKYFGPVYAILIPLGVLFISGLWNGQVQLARWQTLVVGVIGSLALGCALAFIIFGCQTPSPYTGICVAYPQQSFLSWVTAFASLSLLSVAAWMAAAALWPWPHFTTMPEMRRFMSACVLVLLLPLLIFGLVEQGRLLTTRGNITYDAGDVTGIIEAGQYLATHVTPGQLVVARKEIMLYTPGVHYINDFQLLDTYFSQNRAIVWVVRPQFSIAGFTEVARFGAWGIYYRAPTSSHTTLTSPTYAYLATAASSPNSSLARAPTRRYEFGID